MSILKKKNKGHLIWHKVYVPQRDIPREIKLWVTIDDKENHITYTDIKIFSDRGLPEIPDNITAYANFVYPLSYMDEKNNDVKFTNKT